MRKYAGILGAVLAASFVLGANTTINAPVGGEIFLSPQFNCEKVPDHWKCVLPTHTPSPTSTPIPTSTPTPAPTVSPTFTPTPTIAPTLTPVPTIVPTPSPSVGLNVWASINEITVLPMSGPAWTTVASAMSSTASANVANQDSVHDIAVMGQALYAVRTGDSSARTKAVASITSAIGTENGARWLAIGRNLGGYIIAADLLDIRSGPIYDWLASFATKKLSENNGSALVTMRQSAWASGSNASAQEGFVSSALAVYIRDKNLLDWNWMAFRRYVGDRTSTHRITSNSDAWQMVPADPIGIQNKGAIKSGIRLDGAISNDMSRGGNPAWPPTWTQYPWVGLEGSIPAAVVLSRQGYPAFSIVDSALKRAAEYLYAARLASGNIDWYDTSRAPEIKHILNDHYAFGYPEGPTKLGARTISFTDWLSR